MTDRESDCIRAMLNLTRGGVTTWSELRIKMRKGGWLDHESKAALIAINPEIT
tara:strand:- start:6045 stop:6203 length:159 start_codon:yes stop_codon:yes gene_type:complete